MSLSLTNANIIGRMGLLADCTSRGREVTSTSVICTKLEREYAEDEISGWYILFLSGENRGVDREILSSDKQTGLLTFATLENVVDDTVEFAILQDGFLRYGEEAEDVLTEDFKNIGIDILLFLTPLQLKEIHLTKTLDLICLDKFRDAVDADLFWARHLQNSEKYASLFLSIKADYDENENGSIEDSEKLSGKNYGVLKR